MAIEIVCINKNNGNHKNLHEAITHYGWIDTTGKTEKSNRETMVSWVLNGGQAYVKDNFGNITYCKIMVSIKGTKFLQTYSDGKYTDNLLSLPECK